MTAPVVDRCPACSAPTEPRRTAEGHVHPSFCFACTLVDLGEPWEEIRARTSVTEKKAAKRMAGGRVDQVNLG